MPGLLELPPFPDGLHETHLERLSLNDLLNQDAATEEKLWRVCQSHGFFYLDLAHSSPRGPELLDAANALLTLSEQAFRLPHQTKAQVAQHVTGSIFGWKGAGAVAKADPYARSDRGEFWNVSKDVIFANPEALSIEYPSLIRDQQRLFETFMGECHEIGLGVLAALAKKLQIDPAEIRERHKLRQASGDHVRLTYGPGDASAADSDVGKPEKDVRITTFAHFGSVTLLFNWLGGLQIENRASGEWEWVRPVAGHAVCNLGDAMVEFSGGKVASGKHRVVSAPGLQGVRERYSVVYFVRPNDTILMEDLTPLSPEEQAQGLRKEVKLCRAADGKTFTAKEWITMRVLGMGNDIVKR